ncbi:hypothetical protein CBER1_03393 [Cercospora berteroae]|uniref:non-specific serine/threonine protein kinase n=1 Tax=Cercospora berteroae TaxID=357750 RepID=A0A2S6C8G3_9PEZI|nr:hypothetical protein CBER1_03393 [Cercospora berteroae]
MLEEQTLPEYEQRTYHAVHIGDVYRDKYYIIAKLSYGAHSTVWRAKDQKSNSYVSIKVCVLETESKSLVANETRILQHLDKCAQAEKDQGNLGILLTRRASDIFSIPGRLGQHQCIVSKAESASLHALQEAAGSGPALLPLIKPLLHRLLFPLSWLHNSCGVVHTDLSSTNVLTEAQDESLFQQIESELAANPIIPVQSNGETIYPSLRTVRGMTAYPILTDFGMARFHNPNGSTE